MPTLIAVATTAETANRIVVPGVPCSSGINIGDWVRVDNSGNAVLAQADTSSNGKVIGVVESKGSSTLANILISGVSKPIFIGLDQTKEYFLSESVAGTIQDSQPSSAGNIIASVGQPTSTTKLFVKINLRTILA
jgi:hypothetical protein